MNFLGTTLKYNNNDIYHAGNLNVFSLSQNGLVPKTTTSNITDFLRRDGTWATPSYPTSLPANGGNSDTVDGKHAIDFYQDNSVVMNNNSFGGKRLYINSIDNALHGADKRYYVTATKHQRTYNSETYPKLNPSYVSSYSVTGSGTTYTVANSPTSILVYVDDTLYDNVSTPTSGNNYSYSNGKITFGKTITGVVSVYPDSDIQQYLDSPVVSTIDPNYLFDGTYENGSIGLESGTYMKIKIMFSSDGKASFVGYPYGNYFLSYYYLNTPEKAECRTFNRNFKQHGVGWKIGTFTDFIGTNASSAYIQTLSDSANYGRTIIEFIIYSHPQHATYLTEIDWKLDRPNLSNNNPIITKFGPNKMYHDLYFGDQISNKIIITPTGVITGSQLISNIPNGTAPLAVTSSTKVTNLNADLIDGFNVDDTKTGADASTNNGLWTANKIKTQLDGTCKFKKSTGTFAAGGTTYTVTDSFITSDTMVILSPTSNKNGFWSVNSSNGSFIITSDDIEPIAVTFEWTAIK